MWLGGMHQCKTNIQLQLQEHYFFWMFSPQCLLGLIFSRQPEFTLLLLSWKNEKSNWIPHMYQILVKGKRIKNGFLFIPVLLVISFQTTDHIIIWKPPYCPREHTYMAYFLIAGYITCTTLLLQVPKLFFLLHLHHLRCYICYKTTFFKSG